MSPRATHLAGALALLALAAVGLATRARSATQQHSHASPVPGPSAEPSPEPARPQPFQAPAPGPCQAPGDARAAAGPSTRAGRGPDYVQVVVGEHDCKVDRDRMVRVTSTSRAVELESTEKLRRATPAVSTKTTLERSDWTALERCLESTGFFQARSPCEPLDVALGGGLGLVQVDAAIGQRANSVAWTGYSPNQPAWACVAPLLQRQPRSR